jgi:hypothetical protein
MVGGVRRAATKPSDRPRHEDGLGTEQAGPDPTPGGKQSRLRRASKGTHRRSAEIAIKPAAQDIQADQGVAIPPETCSAANEAHDALNVWQAT